MRIVFQFRRFRAHDKGSIAVLAALIFSVIALAMALCFEAANLYVAKLENQRAADLANLAAAATPNPIVNNLPSATAIATAANVVAINGLAGATVSTTSGTSPANADNPSLSTSVTRDIPVLLPNLGAIGTSNGVLAASTAELTPSTASGACLASFLGPTNIYGSASVSGSSCAVSANTYLYVCGGAAVAVGKATVKYTSGQEAPYLCSTASMSPPASAFTYGATITDTIATHPEIVAVKNHLTAMGSPGWPYGSTSPRSTLNPAVSAGTDKTYAAGSVETLPQNVRYGTLTITDSALTFSGSGMADPSCASPTTLSGNMVLNGANTLTFASGCYVISGYVVAQGSATTTFAIAPNAVVTFVFKQYVTNGSGTMRLPDATYSFNGNVNNTNAGTLKVGNGTKVFGAGIVNGTGSMSFLDGQHYVNGGSISNGTGTMSFGNGAFYLWGGSMSNSNTGTMTYGNGPFYFYGGTLYNVKGTLVFGNGPFYFKGGSVAFSNGSTTRFGVGDVDFYGGSISLAGTSTTFGYGGSATTGSATVSLYGGSFSLTTQNLTAVGVTFAFYGGSISMLGVGNIVATAPTGMNPLWGHKDILIVVLGGALSLYQSNNPSDTMSGLIYVPTSNASIYGNQTVNYPIGGCFQIVSGVLDIYQNAKINVAPCAGLTIGASGSLRPVLVQ
ncbi:hypothetical protein [Methylobacterium sp. 77]|uniref:hypothetical protein n=1 Tax=Methylobacterium sp. 77 TaxID=1101192 RepID=UPI000372E539|nr:hypothetical protein [Methylobacterium sp. 77]